MEINVDNIKKRKRLQHSAGKRVIFRRHNSSIHFRKTLVNLAQPHAVVINRSMVLAVLDHWGH